MNKFNFRSNGALLLFSLLGIATPFLGLNILLTLSSVVVTLFIKTLKVISLPILFLSLASTLSSMTNLAEMGKIAKRIIFYTFLTTAIAALIALCGFIYISPSLSAYATNLGQTFAEKSYLQLVLELFPSNFIAPFAEGNAFGVVLIALSLGIGSQFLPQEQKEYLHKGFSTLFSTFLLIAKAVTFVLPVAVWAFMTELILNIQNTSTASLKMLLIFLVCIVSANLIQGLIALPLLLWKNGISQRALFKDMSKAISIAFFTKSSSAALPFSLDLLTNKSNVSPKVANFSLPLCSTINMNGCAQFILLSVLFSTIYTGGTVSAGGYLFWLCIAVFAAIGNAGVPMGCYFLASLLLSSAGVPLVFMGLILPFYPILDMIETAVNVWSDICITKITDKKLKESATISATT